MEHYLALLEQASKKGSYRKRPIETFKEVQTLSSKIKSATKKKSVAKDTETNEKTQTGRAINKAKQQAKIKAGKKALKETLQYEKYYNLMNKRRELEKQLKIATTKDKQEEIEKKISEIDLEIAVDKRKTEILKEAEEYKDEPLKYLVKIQEINQLDSQSKQILEKIKESNTTLPEIVNAIKDLKTNFEDLPEIAKVIKTLPSGVSDVKEAMMSMSTPKQKLEMSPAYASLTPKQKDVIYKKLIEVAPRDTAKKDSIIRNFLSSEVGKQNEIIDDILRGVPVKAKAEELPQAEEFKKSIMDSYINGLISQVDNKNPDEYNFVVSKIRADPTITPANGMQKIREFAREYRLITQDKRNELESQEAIDQENEAEALMQAKEDNINKSGFAATFNREENVPVFNHPADTPAIQPLADALAQETGATEEESIQDAKEAIGATNAEMNTLHSEKPQEMPVQETTPEPQQTMPNLSEIATMKPATVNKKLKELNLPVAAGKKAAEKNKETLRAAISTPSQKQKTKITKRTGKGFEPLSSFPPHLVAGALNKHIKRVMHRRIKTNLNKLDALIPDNKQRNEQIKQHLLRGGGFSDWFFKGLTAPFQLAAKIPLPGIQQVGQLGSTVANAVGLPSLF